MGDRTELGAVERDGRWAVKIAWPNGTSHHFGKFRSEAEATFWIAQHRWMTTTTIKDRALLRRRGRFPNSNAQMMTAK